MMDIDRFDAVTRILTRSGSRRQALTVAFAGSCGTLTWPDAQEAVAKDCKRIKTKAKRKKCLAKTRQGNNPLPLSCADGQRVCQGGCIPSNQCCADGDCPASTPSCCGGGCVNILTNLGHCGRCGAGCGFNEQCGSGTCRCGAGPDACTTGRTCCESSCACSSGFMDPVTCVGVAECPAGSTPCTAATGNCSHGLPGRACCPAGTRCDEGTCRYV